MNMCIYIYIYVYIHIHTYTHTHIHIHIYTYTYTYTNPLCELPDLGRGRVKEEIKMVTIKACM